jgi:hypothetical protein
MRPSLNPSSIALNSNNNGTKRQVSSNSNTPASPDNKRSQLVSSPTPSTLSIPSKSESAASINAEETTIEKHLNNIFYSKKGFNASTGSFAAPKKDPNIALLTAADAYNYCI